MMKKSVLIIFAAGLLAGCTSSELIDPTAPTGPATDGSEIVLKSSHISALTRLPYVGTISETNPLSAYVLTSRADGDYSTLYAGGTMVFKGGVATYEQDNTFSGMNTYPAEAGDDDTTPLYLCGLSPKDKGSWGIGSANAASITITGEEDVMVAAQVSTSKKEVKEDLKIASLTFKHLLTKLEISLKADHLSAPSIWGKVERIELVGVGEDASGNPLPLKNKVEVSLKEGTATYSGAATPTFFGMSKTESKVDYTNVPFKTNAQEIPASGAETVAYSMIAPFDAKKGTEQLIFKLYTSYDPLKNPHTVKVDLDFADGNTSGHAFGITFVFPGDDTAIIGTATVIDWINSGNIEKPVE